MDDKRPRADAQPEIDDGEATATDRLRHHEKRIRALDDRERLLDDREERIAEREAAADLHDKVLSRREIDSEEIYPAMWD